MKTNSKTAIPNEKTFPSLKKALSKRDFMNLDPDPFNEGFLIMNTYKQSFK